MNKPERPKAFSVIRDSIDHNLTTKEVKFGFRKIFAEFNKRVDPNLPFYYYYNTHTRYYKGSLPDFSEPGKK